MHVDENWGETWVGDKSTRNLELKREQWQSGNDGEEVLQVGHKYSRGMKVGYKILDSLTKASCWCQLRVTLGISQSSLW